MSIEIMEPKSLPLYQIMGAPVMAIVQAEAQAAQATAEFIERVGFVTPPGELLNPLDVDDVGTLRMFKFRYKKPGSTGKDQEFEVQIPLLSLIPIPSVQIKEAEIEFEVQIHDVYTEGLGPGAEEEGPDEGDFLAPQRVGIRAGFEKRGVGFPMGVKIKLAEAHVPNGMAALFKVMDQSIRSHLFEPPADEPPESPAPDVEPVPA